MSSSSISSNILPLSINQTVFGQEPVTKQPVYLFSLSNAKGMTVKITNYKATVVSIMVPDKDNKIVDVVLGYDTFAQYWQDQSNYFGAIVDRYANRIANAQFDLAGKTYHLPLNNGKNSLHSGSHGFNQALWQPTIKRNTDFITLVLKYYSPEGEQGFPGELATTIKYTLYSDTNKLKIEYLAESTRDTCINLTNHTYFNLAGEGSGPILNQKIMINADKFTPTDNQQIPTGEIIRVESTPFDLRQMTPIGKHILSKDQQLLLANGYDHNFVLGKASSEPLSLAARACSLDSGIELTLYTTQPGLQFYSGNSLNNKIVGKQGHIYAERTGFALETQHYPDSLHHANFPSTLLKKGDLYQQKSFYHFDIC